MAAPDTLIKYASSATGLKILESRTLRWSSPELFDEPWSLRLDPHLGFDYRMVSNAMLKMATSMIFARELPAGNTDHPLYKAIRRWRSEDRFRDEAEAFDALSELLGPTAETLKDKLEKMVSDWQNMVEMARIVSFSSSYKDLGCWHDYADNFRGVALRFSCDGVFKDPINVEYANNRPKLTTIKEQVDDMVGISRSSTTDSFTARMFVKSKTNANEKEWRCLRILEEEELDCGEDVEDWYMDAPFPVEDLKAVYLGFMMDTTTREGLIELLQRDYPGTAIYQTRPLDDVYELDFVKLS